MVQREGLRAVLALERLEPLLPELATLPPGALAVVSPAVVALHLGRSPSLGVVLRVRELHDDDAKFNSLSS